MVAKPLCPLYKNIIKPLDRTRYPELRYLMNLHKSKGLEFNLVFHLNLHEWVFSLKHPINGDFKHLKYESWQQD